MKHGAIFLGVLAFFSFSTSWAGETVIPHFGQNGLKTSIRLTNPGQQQENVVLSGFDASGQMIGQKSVTLGSDESQTLNAAQLGFSPSWLRVSGSDQVKIAAIHGPDHPQSGWVGVPASEIQTNHWRFFPGNHVVSDEKLAVVNTGYRTTELRLSLKRFSDGVELDSVTETLGAGAKQVFNLNNLFQTPLTNDEVIDVTATEPLAVIGLAVSKNDRFISENRAVRLGPPELIQQIELLGNFLFPEGIAIHQDTGAIFTGGLGNGEIQTVVDGKASVFSGGANGLVSVTGMTIDENHNLLFVCNSDFFYLSVADVVVFDIGTGGEVARFSVPADDRFHFLNDITLDSAGNAYVTDSFSPIIWKVRADLSGMEIFIEDETHFAIRRGFNLNGIAITPDERFLITAIPASGGTTVYRIDLATREIVTVTIDGFFAGGDGLVFRDDRRLLSILFDVAQLSFECDYTRATVQDFPEPSPSLDGATTGKIFGGKLYVVNSQLDHLIFEDGLQETFTLTTIPLSILK